MLAFEFGNEGVQLSWGTARGCPEDGFKLLSSLTAHRREPQFFGSSAGAYANDKLAPTRAFLRPRRCPRLHRSSSSTWQRVGGGSVWADDFCLPWCWCSNRFDNAYAHCLRTTVTFRDLELHPIVVSECTKSLANYAGVVDEYVGAVLSSDEAESFIDAEPPHRSSDRHVMLAFVCTVRWLAFALWATSMTGCSLSYRTM